MGVRAQKFPDQPAVSEVTWAADAVRRMHFPVRMSPLAKPDLDGLLGCYPSRADRVGGVENTLQTFQRDG